MRIRKNGGSVSGISDGGEGGSGGSGGGSAAVEPVPSLVRSLGTLYIHHVFRRERFHFPL